MPELRFIPFNVPLIGDEETEAVVDVLRSGWLTTGPVTARFESLFREHVHCRHALAVNSATAGLHLALSALGIGPGDEVITTPLTFCATVNTIVHTGATPVLADIDDSLNINPDSVEALITPRTKAVLPVHFAGLPCSMERLWRVARERELSIVEDAAHAAGAHYSDGQPVGGGSSQAAVFSFYATKNMTTGEGGMVTTGLSELDERMRLLCLHGMSRAAWSRYAHNGSYDYQVVECGFKYNLTDIAAALGVAQLARLEQMTARRREIARAYDAAFSTVPELQTPPRGAGHCWHLYVLRLNLDLLSIDRAGFFAEMNHRGIGCSVHFIPIPMHAYYRRTLRLRDPCARALAEYPRLLSLPLYAGMAHEDTRRVIGAVLDVVSRHKTRRAFAAGGKG